MQLFWLETRTNSENRLLDLTWFIPRAFWGGCRGSAKITFERKGMNVLHRQDHLGIERETVLGLHHQLRHNIFRQWPRSLTNGEIVLACSIHYFQGGIWHFPWRPGWSTEKWTMFCLLWKSMKLQLSSHGPKTSRSSKSLHRPKISSSLRRNPSATAARWQGC